MTSAHSHKRDIGTAQRTFNTVTVTVGSLYLASRSVTVTLIGTAAASLLTCWALWLARREHTTNDRERQLPTSATSEPSDPARSE